MLRCRSRTAAWAFRLSLAVALLIGLFVWLFTYGAGYYACHPVMVGSEECSLASRWIATASQTAIRLTLVYGFLLVVPALVFPLALILGSVLEIRSRRTKVE